MRVIWSENSSIFLSLKKRRVEWRISAETIRQKIHIFTWRYTHLLTGQFYTACGDVLDPTYLLPVTLGTGGGEMDHPSVMIISPATCRVRDLEHCFFTGRFHGLLCGRASLHPCRTAASSLVANT